MPNSCQFRATSNSVLKPGRAREIRKKLTHCGHRVPLVNPQSRALAANFPKIDQPRAANSRGGVSIELNSGSRCVWSVLLRVSTKIANHNSPPAPRIVVDNVSRRVPETNRFGNVRGGAIQGCGEETLFGKRCGTETGWRCVSVRKVVSVREGDRREALMTGWEATCQQRL